MSAERKTWFGLRAIEWVLDDAPVPADLAPTLIVIARCCDDNGRGSYQSVSTIAEKTGKSAGQVRRDVAQLRELDLIVLGDQSLAEHLPVGQRPTVYDVPLHVIGPKPVREPRYRAERIAPHGQRRRTIPTSVRLAVFARDGDACTWCAATDDLTLDHVHPWSLGGEDTVENLRVLCRPCNSRKGARTEVPD